MFGAISIGVDQPMREGDFVKVYDFVGTVEQIGLRSTRIRTLDRTVITIPNGELANQRIESFAVRDRIRLACTIRLVYQTTAEQMRGVLADLEAILRGHPKIWPDSVTVKFSTLGASSLDIDIMAWFQTSDWAEFQAIRQDVLLSFMEAIERRGTRIALPTQTVLLSGRDSLQVKPSGGTIAS
jgi:MscS family membrane protein